MGNFEHEIIVSHNLGDGVRHISNGSKLLVGFNKTSFR